MNVYNLNHFRTLRGYTPHALSKAADLRPSAVSDFESHRRNMTFESALKLADSLRISPYWLIYSPVILTADSVARYIRYLKEYNGGIIAYNNNTFALKPPFNQILININKKKSDLRAKLITQDSYNDWKWNLSKFDASVHRENNIVHTLKNVWRFATINHISDREIGECFGYKPLFASEEIQRIRVGDIDVSSKEYSSKIQHGIDEFIIKYDANYNEIYQEFIPENDNDIEHLLVAIDESSVGSFQVNETGIFKFADPEVQQKVAETFQNQV